LKITFQIACRTDQLLAEIKNGSPDFGLAWWPLRTIEERRSNALF
jgi:hypothetical protein